MSEVVLVAVSFGGLLFGLTLLAFGVDVMMDTWPRALPLFLIGVLLSYIGIVLAFAMVTNIASVVVW